ncbi:unnamed protein product [Phaeothamnion confervicola]
MFVLNSSPPLISSSPSSASSLTARPYSQYSMEVGTARTPRQRGGSEDGKGASDTAAPNPFSQYYAQLTHQQNMLQDGQRTGLYRSAILENARDFAGKVVLDVGTGSGVLAFFAAQAGARKVYAVEASAVAEAAQALVDANNMSHVITVVRGKVEEVELPERVDIIISEPIGFLLVHERMLESYIMARDRFLKPGGLMFPAVGTIVIAPVTDPALHAEQAAKATFWDQRDFLGIDLSVLREKALQEHFGVAVVGFLPASSVVSSNLATHVVDFRTVTCEELKSFEIPLRLSINRTAIVHGLGCWFELAFADGSQRKVVLSTGPESPGTHWYQCRLLLQQPIGVNATQASRPCS